MRALVAPARAAGRAQLLEDEALALVEALGFAVPRRARLADAAAARELDLAAFEGPRVVLKALSPEIAHKTELGAVAVVPREAEAVRRALAEMEARLADRALAGFLVVQHVPHDLEPGGELLLGLRHSRELGPVVTLAPGGVAAETLARAFTPEAAPALFSPALDDAASVRAALAGAEPLPALARGDLRGRPARASADDLARAVQLLLEAAVAVPDPLLELELNPLAFTGGRPWALDALARLGGPCEVDPPRPLERALHMLHPRSVAVVGVSARDVNPARALLRNTLAAGFPAEALRVVKPGAQEIDGVRCVPDLAALEPVDLLVLSIPAREAAAAVAEVIRLRRAEGIVLIPGGLGEREGTAGAAAELRALLHRARRDPQWSGPVVNGPNCLGLRSLPARVDTLFIPRERTAPPADVLRGRHAPAALISQSGAFAVARPSRMPWLELREVVTIGNQLDLTAADWLDVLGRDPELAVIACYVEGFRPGDGLRFARRVRELAAAGRTVVVYRAGRTPEGVAASASHTATLAGDPVASRALLARAGALVADTLDDFDDLLRLAVCLAGRRVDGLGLGVLSNAGFECVAAADNLAPLRLARLGEGTLGRLRALFEEQRLAGFVDVHHPLDTTPIADDATFCDAAGILLDDPAVHVGVVGCVPHTGALATLPADLARPDGTAARLVRLAERTDKAFAAVVDAGPPYDAFAAALQEAGLPTFRSADRATRLLARYARYRVALRSVAG